VRACNDVVVPEMEKLARKARFETVVIPVYAAAYMIVSNNDITEFLAEREVKTHAMSRISSRQLPSDSRRALIRSCAIASANTLQRCGSPIIRVSLPRNSRNG